MLSVKYLKAGMEVPWQYPEGLIANGRPATCCGATMGIRQPVTAAVMHQR